MVCRGAGCPDRILLLVQFQLHKINSSSNNNPKVCCGCLKIVMSLEKCGDRNAPVEAVEGALLTEAGANFTWDSVQLNLRSVFGERG